MKNLQRLYWRIGVWSLGLAFVGGPIAAWGKHEGEDHKVAAKVENFLGKETLEVLLGATRVEGFRVNPEQVKPPTDQKTIGGYPITATGQEQGKEFAKAIRHILFNEKTYLFDTTKRCAFAPGVAFRLWKGDEAVEVLLCFSCDELEVIVKDPTGKELRRVREDSDPMRPALVGLAKKAFPKDPELQKLKERRQDEPTKKGN
jgi:hypothetical protein